MKKIVKLFAILILVTVAVVCFAACEQADEYAVTCAECQHGYVIVSETRVAVGEKVILAAHPDDGYQLTHFVVDGEVLEGCSFVMPQKDVTVSAEFQAITYSVTYVLGDATVEGNNPDSYTVESATELIQPHKEGYEICGWYRYCEEPENNYNWNVEDFRVLSLEGLYGNLTLYAKYYNPMHEVSCEYPDDVKGSYYVDLYQAYYGDTVQVEVYPDIGYELDQVFVNGTAIDGTSFTMPMCDVVVTATFKPIVYQIKYVVIGGDGVMYNPNPEYLTVDDWSIWLENASMDGYYFVGWYLDEEHNQPVWSIDIYSFSERSLTLYAYFEREFKN